jgi:hypothetical protein
MNTLLSDLINYSICPLLKDTELINLFRCNQCMNTIKAPLKKYVSMNIGLDDFYPLINKLEISTFNGYNTFMEYLNKYNRVRHLKFCKKFKHPVIIPEFITDLIFSQDFNHPVNIPNSVQNLTFGESFNQHIIIPNSVQNLIFGLWFNQSIIVPNYIKNLTFGHAFNQLISIPESVTNLTFGHAFNQPITVSRKVKLIYLNYDNGIRKIPDNVTYID